MTDGALIVLAGAIGTTTTILVGLYKDARNRKWDAQDRKIAANILRAEAVETATALALKVEEAAKAVTEEAEKLRDDVAHNTQISEEAKRAAERASAKIADVKVVVEDLKTNGFTKS